MGRGDDLSAPGLVHEDRLAKGHRHADLRDQVEEGGKAERKGERHQRPPPRVAVDLPHPPRQLAVIGLQRRDDFARPRLCPAGVDRVVVGDGHGPSSPLSLCHPATGCCVEDLRPARQVHDLGAFLAHPCRPAAPVIRSLRIGPRPARSARFRAPRRPRRRSCCPRRDQAPPSGPAPAPSAPAGPPAPPARSSIRR